MNIVFSRPRLASDQDPERQRSQDQRGVENCAADAEDLADRRQDDRSRRRDVENRRSVADHGAGNKSQASEIGKLVADRLQI